MTVCYFNLPVVWDIKRGDLFVGCANDIDALCLNGLKNDAIFPNVFLLYDFSSMKVCIQCPAGHWIRKTSELFDSLNLLALSDSARSKIVELEGLVPYAPNAFISATCKIEILLCH